jgi:hypothetical protein
MSGGWVTKRIFKSNVEYAMVIVGVLMIAVVAKLADAADSGQHEYPRPVRRFLARQAIRAVAMIGSAVDRVSGDSEEQRPPVTVAAERSASELFFPPSLTL